MSAEILLPYGLGSPDLVEYQNGYFVCKDVCGDLEKLSQLLQRNGFSLRLESAYRPFEKQLSIWNRKARGELALLDDSGKPMERPQDEEELMHAILTWSALPGASRHHLGTDIDVVDGNACPEGYEVFESRESFGFNRVFVPGRGKIRPEGWHIAHLPTSRRMLEGFSLDTLRSIYEKSDIACKDAILANLPQLAEDYIYPYFI